MSRVVSRNYYAKTLMLAKSGRHFSGIQIGKKYLFQMSYNCTCCYKIMLYDKACDQRNRGTAIHCFQNQSIFKYAIYFSLFSNAVIVGRPRSSLAPIEHFTSIKLSSFLPFAASSSLSKSLKSLTLTAFG